MIQFLKSFFKALRESQTRETIPNIQDQEDLCRYIFSSNHVSATKVKYAAFLPDKNGETSVFRISGCTENEIWDIGINHVAKLSGRILKARGDFAASHVRKSSLDVISETSRHDLHANLVNWPTERDEQKLIAIELANSTKLCKP